MTQQRLNNFFLLYVHTAQRTPLIFHLWSTHLWLQMFADPIFWEVLELLSWLQS